MRTSFTPDQLADPDTVVAEKAIRTCVHCGFCTATCPTYVLLGDERDSPRGRIVLMQEMLEKNAAPTPEVVKHIDRCLSCLACTTTCPSGVDYRHLVDHARVHIEQTHKRPLGDRLFRRLIARTLPYPKRFAAALRLGRLASPFAGLVSAFGAKRLAGMMRLAKATCVASPLPDAPAPAERKGRVILATGCAEPVLHPEHQAAVSRLLARLGYEVIRAPNEGCCGALVHHMGRDEEARAFIRRKIDAWTPLIEQGVDAIIVTASGCGATVKDYGHILRSDTPAYAARAANISALAKDLSEFIPPSRLKGGRKLRVAWHSACSLQHGQKITAQPIALLREAGFEVVTPTEAHLCCGSAGVYSLLEPELAGRLGDRKAKAIAALKPDVIVTSNIGCAVQLSARTNMPVVHIAELLDWAMGGPAPKGLEKTP